MHSRGSLGIPSRGIGMFIAAMALMVALAAIVADCGAAEVQIAVLISNNGQPYNDTIAGFKQHLEKKGLQVDYRMYPLAGDAAKAVQVVQEIKKARPALIFCIGSLAAEKALKEITDIPIISSMVLRTEEIKRANATGVSLELPAETQFQWIRRFLPKAKTIGVLYNAKENRETIEAAAKAAQKAGLKLDAQEVPSPKDIPSALEKLTNSADALWGIPDTLVLNPQTAKLVLLFSFRNRIPFIGPSAAWAKAGALYSLDCDYADMGSQCAEMAVKILQGATVSSIPPAAPRKITYAINAKTAGEMTLKLPDDLVRNAHTTF